jgi:hypothetical protein
MRANALPNRIKAAALGKTKFQFHRVFAMKQIVHNVQFVHEYDPIHPSKAELGRNSNSR